MLTACFADGGGVVVNSATYPGRIIGFVDPPRRGRGQIKKQAGQQDDERELFCEERTAGDVGSLHSRGWRLQRVGPLPPLLDHQIRNGEAVGVLHAAAQVLPSEERGARLAYHTTSTCQ